MSVRTSIRQHCLMCVGGSRAEVHTCGGESVQSYADENGQCKFFPFRLNKGRPKVKMIREFCLVCQGGSQLFVRECHEDGCAFHRYRMGRTGNRMNLTDEQREVLRARLSESRR